MESVAYFEIPQAAIAFIAIVKFSVGKLRHSLARAKFNGFCQESVGGPSEDACVGSGNA